MIVFLWIVRTFYGKEARFCDEDMIISGISLFFFNERSYASRRLSSRDLSFPVYDDKKNLRNIHLPLIDLKMFFPG